MNPATLPTFQPCFSGTKHDYHDQVTGKVSAANPRDCFLLSSIIDGPVGVGNESVGDKVEVHNTIHVVAAPPDPSLRAFPLGINGDIKIP